MRKPELDYILNTMLDHTPMLDGNTVLDARKDVSDLNFTVDKPFQVEYSGQLVPIETNPPIEKLTPFQTETLALNLVNGTRTVQDIRDVVSAVYGPVPVTMVAEYLRALQTAGVVSQAR